MTDDEAMAKVATEIALWQGSALYLPLSQVKAMAVNGLDDLAASLAAFNQHYPARDRDPQALDRAVVEVVRTATVAAIFVLGGTQRTQRATALS